MRAFTPAAEPAAEALQGGYMNEVVRVGDTVRRDPGGGPFGHQLLLHLEAVGYRAAPRFLGADHRGREVLTFVEGATRTGAVADDAVLTELGRLLRQLHDATAGTTLAGPCEVVCHNDVSPRNTVFAEGNPLVLVDWDSAAPGARRDDLAWASWQFIAFGPGSDPVWVADRMRVLLDAYGFADRRGFLATVAACQRRSRSKIAVESARGSARHIAMRDAGALDALAKVVAYTESHAAEIELLIG